MVEFHGEKPVLTSAEEHLEKHVESHLGQISEDQRKILKPLIQGLKNIQEFGKEDSLKVGAIPEKL